MMGNHAEGEASPAPVRGHSTSDEHLRRRDNCGELDMLRLALPARQVLH